jgi:ABC-2 type transport system permease protein
MWNLMKKDLKVWGQNKQIWMFLIAVLIMFIIGTAFYVTEEPASLKAGVSIGVIDKDKSEYSALMVSYFKDNKVFSQYVSVIVGEEKEIKQKFDDGELTMYLLIPPNFAESLIYIENIPMQAVISKKDTTKAIILKNMLLGYERYISAVEINCVALYDMMQEASMPQNLIDSENFRISYDLIFTALGRENFFDYIEKQDVAGIPLRMYYTYEAFFLLLSYLAVFAGMDLLLERKNGIVSRLTTMGTKVTTVVIAKFILYLGLFSIPVLIFFGLGRVGLFPKTNLSEIVFSILYFGTTVLVFLFLGTLLRKLPNYLLVANAFILFCAIIGAGLIPLFYLPDAMKQLAKLSPNYWFLNLCFTLHLNDKTLSPLLILGMVLLMLLLIVCIGFVSRRKEEMVREDI